MENNARLRDAIITQRERFLYLLNVPEECSREEERILRPLLQIRKCHFKSCPPFDPIEYELTETYMDRSIGIHSESYTDEVEDLIRSGFAIPKPK